MTTLTELAKHQPCGCVLCTCEDEEQCHGCGAKHCGTHPIGQFPNPAHPRTFRELDEQINEEIRSEMHAASIGSTKSTEGNHESDQ